MASQITPNDTRTRDEGNPVAPSEQLVDYFGPPRWKRPRADERLGRETFDDYEAYDGHNYTLKDRIDFMIVNEKAFYTDILPIKSTDEIHIKWDVFSFDRTMMDLEPTEGVPRLVTARKEQKSDTLVRRGLAMMIEHGFYRTEQGRRHYMLNLQQIASSARLTTYAGIMDALLGARNHYRMWNLEHGPEQTGANVKTLERERWGCVNADPKGVFLLAANARFDMQREGVSPNTLIVPPRMGIFCAWNEQRTSYKESGPKADVVLYGEQLNIPRIVGCDVHECESFDVDFSADPINQCARHRQCGEFFVVPKDAEQVQIYSAASDTFETITKDEMKTASGSDGQFVIFRPHQTWEMSTAIMCERGEGLGVTFHGNHSFLLQSDNVRKIHLGHYTYYSKSVVADEKRLMLLEDVFCTGYIGGESCEFYQGDGTGLKAYKDLRDSRREIGARTPSLICMTVAQIRAAGAPNFNPQNLPHFDFSTLLDKDPKFERPRELKERWERDYIEDNYDCFPGCLRARTAADIGAGKTFTEVHTPCGHWDSVYSGVRKHRTARTGAYIKPHPC